jgi:hypothetical protein
VSELRKFQWKITKQEKQSVRVAYQVDGDTLVHNCVVDNVKPDITEDLLQQQIKNAVIAHYMSYHRWEGKEGSFEADLHLKTVKKAASLNPERKVDDSQLNSVGSVKPE